MGALETVRLTNLMAATEGSAAVAIGLIDGPVMIAHPGLHARGIQALNGAAGCGYANSAACQHGTFVAGILHARRGEAAPGLSPGCRLLTRAVFGEQNREGFPSCEPEELAAAITECVQAGARLVNLSLGVAYSTPAGQRALVEALDYAARSGVLVIAATGNQSSVGGSPLASHPAVLPVTACGSDGRIASLSNLGPSIGRRGLSAPGEDVQSLAAGGGTRRFSGTSAAAPFVTGTAALLWSTMPSAPVALIRQALTYAGRGARKSITPPLLDAQAAWESLKAFRA
jgi:subtilisin family serine protease